MATSETGRTNYPPYLPFTTFENFITELEDGIPARIDKSVLQKKSGSIQSWLPKALKYFGLVSENNAPTPKLQALVQAKGQARKKLFGELAKEHYAALFDNVNTKTGTNQQLIDWFKEQGLAASTATRSAAFFLDLAKNGGVELSPHFKKVSPPQSKPRGAKRKKQAKTKTEDPVENGAHTEHQGFPEIPPALEHKLILGLIEMLPEPESQNDFTEEKREKWLQYARMTFDMVYGATDD